MGSPPSRTAVLATSAPGRCIDGQATAANQRIAEALGTPDAEEDPGDEGDDNIEQAS